MTPKIPCLLLTRDDELVQRVKAYVGTLTALQVLRKTNELDTQLAVSDPALILLDVRGIDLHDLVPRLHTDWPRTLILALGVPRSDPLLEAEALGVYAVEELEFDGRRLQAMIQRSLDYIRLAEEVRLLRDTRAESGRPQDSLTPARAPAMATMRLQLPALRHSGRADDLIADIVDSVVRSGMVLRAGLFARIPESGVFKLKIAFGVRDEVRALEFEPDASLVRWLEQNAHLVARSGLSQLRTSEDQMMLRRALDSMGAELIVPLQGRRMFMGWLFIGQRSTGLAFDAADLLDIMVFAEQAAVAIENATLYDDLAFQHTLTETLLHSLSAGIELTSADGQIRWVNDSAEKILGLELTQVLNQPVEKLGSRLADMLHRTLNSEMEPAPQEWTDQPTQQCFSARTKRLMNGATGLGAVAFIHDLTRERILNEKQEELERTVFWNELAAALSHEIRNPLVAIKTFAQLLPERYQDPEFQNEFRTLVSGEVDRLNAIIDQINDFAHRPELQFKALALAPLVAKSVALVLPEPSPIQIILEIPDELPPLWGDEKTLVESFAHLLRNAVEALDGQTAPQIRINASVVHEATIHARLVIAFADNGHGIPQALVDKVFSPFCTTKARGLGLGLPIVKRTLVDHNGRVEIRSDATGTTVTLQIPLRANGVGQP
jgi:nitrogen-specific signal transduction histidine kinase